MERKPSKHINSPVEPTLTELALIENSDYDLIDKIEVKDGLLAMYIASLPKVKPASYELCVELARRIKNNENPQEAKEHLFNSVAMMVVSQAIKYGDPRDVMDRVEEGNTAVWEKAIPKYDPTHFEYRFSTYAMWWIRGAQMRFSQSTGRPERIPELASIQMKNIHKFSESFVLKHGRNPTISEIVEKTGIKPDRTRYLVEVSQRKHISLSDVTKDGKAEIDEIIRDDNALYGSALEDDIENRITYEKTLRKIEKAMENMDNLSPRNKEILILKLKGTYNEELGRKYGVTGARIKQILNQTLRHFLKNTELHKILYLYLNSEIAPNNF